MTDRITNSQLYQLIATNFRELIREPGVLFWGTVFPILMSIGLGMAFTRKKDVVTIVAVAGENHLVWHPNDSASALLQFLDAGRSSIEKDKTGTFSRTITIADDKLGNTTFVFRSMEWQQAPA